MSVILECRSLTKKFGTTTALSDLNLTLERGRIIGLLGPNGSGKTTLIKIINGLLVPDTGSIHIAGMEPGVESKKIISFLPERTYLPDWMKITETIAFFKDFYEDFEEKRAYDMLHRLNLDPNKRLKALSKGTKEKVQLILVMSRRADLYCLDEPIGGVDPAARDYILNTIITNYDENATVILSTHLISDIENVLDEVIFIKEGRLILHAPVDEIREKEGKSIDSLFREVFKC
ncbi:MAG: ABC transporter ATP-binding protein [Anaerolineaceae bacterium]|nr:MAG: ABC transporter ATP-binding protein [Anaerolineaceae bacterium]